MVFCTWKEMSRQDLHTLRKNAIKKEARRKFICIQDELSDWSTCRTTQLILAVIGYFTYRWHPDLVHMTKCNREASTWEDNERNNNSFTIFHLHTCIRLWKRTTEIARFNIARHATFRNVFQTVKTNAHSPVVKLDYCVVSKNCNHTHENAAFKWKRERS